MKRIFHAILIFSLASSGAVYAADGADKNDSKNNALSEAWNEWDVFLAKHVDPKDGRVAYDKVDFEALEKHVQRYSKMDPKDWDDTTRKAAYINFYNAAMIYNILKHAKKEKIDVGSKKFLTLEINEIDVPGGNIWNGDYKMRFAGQDLNLDNIEHDLIRGQASGKLAALKVGKLDPRIHAAVNCAAASCPRVREKAYRDTNVDEMLDENVKEWLATPSQFSKAGDDTLKANQIVYWYYEDFDNHGKSVGAKKGAGDYLAGFVSPKTNDGEWIAKHLKKHFNDRSKFSLKLSSNFDFFYEWQINDQRNR